MSADRSSAWRPASARRSSASPRSSRPTPYAASSFRPDGLWGSCARSVRDGRMMVVVAAYLVGFVLHAVAIWLLPLYLAQALVAMSLPVTALASHRVARTACTRRLGARSALVTPRAWCCSSLGAGEPGDVVTTTTPFVVAPRGSACAALARAASLAGAAPARAPVLGLLAGLGYAGLGDRGARRRDARRRTARWWSRALAVPSFSLVAFWLYSLRHAPRARCRRRPPPLIVAQTFVPAAVGVALLGDGVREGWWPAVVVGLLLATGRRRPCSGLETSEVPRLRATGVLAGSRSTTSPSTSSILLQQVGVERHAGGLDVLGDLLGPAGADDRRGDVGVLQHPGDRELGQAQPGLVGDRLQLLDPLEDVVLAASG